VSNTTKKKRHGGGEMHSQMTAYFHEVQSS